MTFSCPSSRFSAPSSVLSTSRTRSLAIAASPGNPATLRNGSQSSWSAVRPPTPGRRHRRRGPRSHAALVRRRTGCFHPYSGGPRGEDRGLPDVACDDEPQRSNSVEIPHGSAPSNGEPPFSVTRTPTHRFSETTVEQIVIFSVNINGLLKGTHFTDLKGRLEATKPHIIAVQETHLDSSYEDVSIPEYVVVGRLDRKDCPK